MNKKDNIKKTVKDREEKLVFSLIEVMLIMIVTVVFGIIIGGFTNNLKSPFAKRVESSIEEREVQELVDVYKTLKHSYYGDLDHKKMLEAGISGMINFLDDEHSIYMGNNLSQNFNDEMDGSFVGMGVTVQQIEEGQIKIIDIFAGSPAEKVGIKVGDEILKVDNKLVKDNTLEEIVKAIRGKKGTKFKITIKREDEELKFEVTRDTINLSSVSGELYEKEGQKVAYIRISTFAANTTKQFKDKMEEFVKAGASSVVIDLRNNTGGHLTVVEAISEMFLNKGDVVYQLKDKKETISYKNKNKRLYKLPVVFITNEGSASASEVFVAALKENNKAVSVGVKTFGKGSVQTAKDLSSGATIKFTVKEWLTPKGNQINKKGIEVDYPVEISSKYYETLSDKDDDQLQKALAVARGEI